MRSVARLVLVVLSVPLLAAAVMLPEWQQQLNSQLKKEQNCEVNYLSNLRISAVNGEETVFARAHCMDKRAFDVSRMGPGKPYKIQECTTNAC
jgi:hypothetical protein